jgi:hypothetical protein
MVVRIRMELYSVKAELGLKHYETKNANNPQ